MQLTITNLNVNLSYEGIERIRQKTYRMFNKIDDRIQKIKVILDDINGPKAGKDKHCRIVILTKGMPEIVVTDNQTSVMTAVNIALSRARLTLLRKVKRRQKILTSPKKQTLEVVIDEPTH
ncbi:MAG: hypothetical protein P8I03_07915 [Thalassotalea sp.]|nr:hypothetical protein [Thalassotalea sp.]